MKTQTTRRLLTLASGLVLLLALLPQSGSAKGLTERLKCKNDYDSFRDFALSEASMDFYHGLLFLGSAATVSLEGGANRRWSGRNDFDTGIRGGLRIGTSGSRRKADTISDVTLALSAAIIPFSGIAAQHWRDQDCVETWDMATDAVESFGLTVFITSLIKEVSGRERPFVRRCGGSAPPDADCSSEDRNLTFISGHSSVAAAGAGLTCAFAFKRNAWGSSTSARWAPCALGSVAALTTGILRIGADRHWASDVLAGFAVGAVVGVFDTWGPLDAFKFSVRNRKGKLAARGAVLPHTDRGAFGAQVLLSF